MGMSDACGANLSIRRSDGCSVQLFAATPSAPVQWRLLSGNNRECGRGVESYATVDQCVAVVSGLQRVTGRMERRNRRADAHRWVWELLLDGRPVAASANSLDRLVRCEQAATQFLAQFTGAVLRPSLVVSGARRWGTVA